MELKVWVDGVQRVVCGLAERTTCQEVIYALAHATQRTGRFVLVEKFRKTERSLSPHDRPLELLTKWGEYASDVQFVLRCLEDTTATAASPKMQSQRPSSAMIQKSKSSGIINPVNQAINRYRRVSSGENGLSKAATLTDSTPVVATRNRHNGLDSASSNNNNQHRIFNGNGSTVTSTMTPTTTTPTNANGVLKPYFVDTSNPTPESGTLLRPTSSTMSTTTSPMVQRQQPVPVSFEAAPSPQVLQQNFVVARRPGALSPVQQPAQYSPSVGGGPPPLRATMMTSGVDNDAERLLPNGVGGSLTVLSHSAHESLANTTTTTTSSFDSSGATLFLESSYGSSNNAVQPPLSGKQLDLSQTSFCSSSMSSTASTGAFSGSVQNQPRMNGVRPPPPSYDTYVQMHKRGGQRDQLLMINRSGQNSPAPLLAGQGTVPSRSRTPVPPVMEQHQAGQMTREQLIRLIESQQFQLQGQCQTLRSYDTEIAQRESQDRSIRAQTPIMEHLRRELQQLEVERVHVKQKAEELRRQNLDAQLATLRQTLADTLLESAKLDEKLKSMDAQMTMNEDRIRSISNDLERERNEVFVLTASSSVGSSLNDSLLASNEAFEARMRGLDELLREKRKQLECGSGLVEPRSESLSPIKNLMANIQQSAGMAELMGQQQRPVENPSGVWV